MKLPSNLKWKHAGKTIGQGGQASVIEVFDETDVDKKAYALKALAKNKPEQANGHCSYLKKGDWELNLESTLVDYKTKKVIKKKGEDWFIPISLLWDSCKECGINDEIDEKEWGINEKGEK